MFPPRTNKFAVKFEPIIKYVDVVVQVTPADARIERWRHERRPSSNGAYTHKLQEGQPLQVEARRDGYVPVSRSFSAEELAKLGNKVTIELENEKPRLPDSLVAKPGAAIDPDVNCRRACWRRGSATPSRWSSRW